MVYALAITLLLSVQKRDLHNWNHIRVVLLPALELNELKVRAMCLGGELSTDGGPTVIDRAAASLGIQKMAGLAEYWILLASQDPFVLPHLRVPLSRGFLANVKILCQSFEVTFCVLN